MITTRILDSLPLPVFFLLVTVLLLLAYEGGFRLGLHRRDYFEDGKRSQAGAVVGSLLGLVAFILAFTFGSTNARFDARKQLVITEANVIGTAYLRGQLMPEPNRSEISNQLRTYVDQRLLGAESARVGELDRVSEAITQSETILDTLWQQMVNLSSITTLDSVTRGLLIEAINEVIDIHTKRIATAVQARLPSVIWVSLGFAVILGMSVLGYHGGLAGLRSIFVSAALVLTIAFVFVLIASLDRPGGTLFDVDQQAMIDLRATMSK